MANFGWDYPPGVTGNEPQITGQWPCECLDPRPHPDCQICSGTGIIGEDVVDMADTENAIRNALKKVFGESFRVGFEYDDDQHMLIVTDFKWLEGTDYLRDWNAE